MKRKGHIWKWRRVNPGGEIRDDTIDIINNLLPKKVIILGGKNVISDDLECEILKKIKFEQY